MTIIIIRLAVIIILSINVLILPKLINFMTIMKIFMLSMMITANLIMIIIIMISNYDYDYKQSGKHKNNLLSLVQIGRAHV